MNFQLKNFLILKTLKSFYLEYYKVLTYYLSNSLKNFIGSKMYLLVNNYHYNIDILNEFLFFKTTNLTSEVTDTVQEFNPKILIFLPFKIKNLKNNTSKIIYYLLGEVPKYTSEKNLIINGLKKTFISKLILTTSGIFYNSFIKNLTTIFYAKIIFGKTFVINIILEEEECFCLLNNYKYNLISLLYLLGIYSTDIIKYSRYNNSFF